MLTRKQAEYRTELLGEGRRLFYIVVNELNDLDTRINPSYRRQEEHEDICIALALLMRATGMNKGGDH